MILADLVGIGRRRRARKPPVGARPGTFAIDEDAEPTRFVVHHYSAEEWEKHDVEEVSELSGLLERPGSFWIDVQGFRDEARLRALGESLALHPLVLEDAVNVPQRPRSEPYTEWHLVVARAPTLGEGDELEIPQVSILFNERIVVTFQERYLAFFEPVRQRMADGFRRPIRSLGSDYLAYVLLDTLVDHHFPLVDTLLGRLEQLEEETTADPVPETLLAINRKRRQFAALRRVVGPQRAAVRDLLEGSSPFVTDEVRSYLADTHSHIAQVADMVEGGRDGTMALMDIYLSMVSHRTNEIMKVLTLMSSIFIPLTFVAGIYGMNFEHMPELSNPRAYPMVLVVMGGITVVMVAYFRHRGWVRSTRRSDGSREKRSGRP